ncbi:unnamed protein product, partial [Iphiclides podalirius]
MKFCIETPRSVHSLLPTESCTGVVNLSKRCVPFAGGPQSIPRGREPPWGNTSLRGGSAASSGDGAPGSAVASASGRGGASTVLRHAFYRAAPHHDASPTPPRDPRTLPHRRPHARRILAFRSPSGAETIRTKSLGLRRRSHTPRVAAASHWTQLAWSPSES